MILCHIGLIKIYCWLMEKKEKEPMDELNKAFEEFDIETPLTLTNEDKLDEGEDDP